MIIDSEVSYALFVPHNYINQGYEQQTNSLINQLLINHNSEIDKGQAISLRAYTKKKNITE